MGGGHHHLTGIPLKARLQELIFALFNQGVLMKTLDQSYKHNSTAPGTSKQVHFTCGSHVVHVQLSPK